MLTKVDPKSLTFNPFALIGSQWALITAGTKEACNTMTASWGGVGIMWNKPAVTVYIRPQRYTKHFVDQEETFTLSFLPEKYRKELAYCGRTSGRDEDKIAHCGFTLETSLCGAPYFAEAELVLVCRKMYRQTLSPDSFLDQELIHQNYPQQDFHDMYIAEILEAYKKA